MKAFSLMAGLFLIASTSLHAQVKVEVTLEQEQFLGGETMPIAIRVTNRSGQTLRLGDQPDWLTFSIESTEGFVVGRMSDVPVLGEFTIESSQVAIKRVDLAPYFILTRQGHYTITATVRIKQWNQVISSPPKSFDVISGARIWSQEFGVPVTAGASNLPPEVRKYTLEQANYLRNQLRLYLRVTDVQDSKIFKVVPIGPMISFGQPEPQVDKSSYLHILYQTGPHVFSYIAYNTEGELLVRQTYDYAGQRPRLLRDDLGNITVVGGIRRPASTDMPPVTPAAKPPEAIPAPGGESPKIEK